jgi:hypothetical protein
MIKHFSALAAVVTLLSFAGVCKAEGQGGLATPRGQRPAGNDAGDPGKSNVDTSEAEIAAEANVAPGKTETSPEDRLSREARQIQADVELVQKDCANGKYKKAEADLDLLIQHRQQYYDDLARARASRSNASAAPTGSH